MKYSNSKLTFLNGIPDGDCHKFDMNHIVITGGPHSGKTYWAIRTLLDLVSTQPFPTERKKALLHTGEHHVLSLIELMGSMLLAYGYPAFDSVNPDKLADLRYIQGYLGSILDFFKKYNYELITTNVATALATRLVSTDTDSYAFIVTDAYPLTFTEPLYAFSERHNAVWIETHNAHTPGHLRRIRTATNDVIASITINVELNIDMGTATNAHYPISHSSSRKTIESIEEISAYFGKQIRERAEYANERSFQDIGK